MSLITWTIIRLIVQFNSLVLQTVRAASVAVLALQP